MEDDNSSSWWLIRHTNERTAQMRVAPTEVLVEDTERTRSICEDIATAVRAGRNCLSSPAGPNTSTSSSMLAAQDLDPLVLHGKMGKKARTAVTKRLAEPRPDGGILLAATAGLIGEGFDGPPLDTLFLAFPIKFKGSVIQYVGRVLRPTDTKTRVEVHDYVDTLVPVLARQHNERRSAYVTLGFDLPSTGRRRSGTPRALHDTPTNGIPPHE
jgi:superfamily II DNA or RNA helicase